MPTVPTAARTPMRFMRSAALVTLAGLSTMPLLGGCSIAEPARAPDINHDRPVRVLVSAHSPEQLILGEIYLQVLAEAGREADLVSESSPQPLDRLAQVRSGEADLVIGCTGNFLDRLDPVRARELSAEIAADTVEDPADQTHREFVGVLPGSLTTTNPSSAEGCTEEVDLRETPDLPENIVPVFSRDLFDRDETDALAAVTRLLTTEEIATLRTKLEKEGSVSTVVSEWLSY